MDNIKRKPGASPFEVSFTYGPVEHYRTRTTTWNEKTHTIDGWTYVIAPGAAVLDGKVYPTPGLQYPDYSRSFGSDTSDDELNVYLTLYEVRLFNHGKHFGEELRELDNGGVKYVEFCAGWSKDEKGHILPLPTPRYIFAIGFEKKSEGVVMTKGGRDRGARMHYDTDHRYDPSIMPDEVLGDTYYPSTENELSLYYKEEPLSSLTDFETRRVIRSEPLLSARYGKVTMNETAWLCVGIPETQEPDKKILLSYDPNFNGVVLEDYPASNTPRDAEGQGDKTRGPSDQEEDDDFPPINWDGCTCNWCKALYRHRHESLHELESQVKELITDLRKKAKQLWSGVGQPPERLTRFDDAFKAIGVPV